MPPSGNGKASRYAFSTLRYCKAAHCPSSLFRLNSGVCWSRYVLTASRIIQARETRLFSAKLASSSWSLRESVTVVRHETAPFSGAPVCMKLLLCIRLHHSDAVSKARIHLCSRIRTFWWKNRSKPLNTIQIPKNVRLLFAYHISNGFYEASGNAGRGRTPERGVHPG